jgi:hypothetical protein
MNSTNRPAQLSPDEAVAYKSVAPLAVASFGISVVSALAIAGLWLAASRSGKPVYEPGLLVAPLTGLVFALIAGKQIRASDGTRSGRGLARFAFWTALLTCLVYGTYLVAVDLAIRNNAAQFSIEWFDKAATGPPEAAFLLCIDPATRQSLDQQDLKGIRERFDNELSQFSRNDIVRMIRRAGASHEVRLRGIKDWVFAEGGYVVQPIFEFRCPEGKYDLLLPVLGRDMPAVGGRAWQVSVRKATMISRETTAFGRLIFDLQAEAIMHLREWVQTIDAGKVHDAFLQTLPMGQREIFKDRLDSPQEKQFESGGLILVEGKPPTDEQRQKYGSEIVRKFAINTSPGSAMNQVGPPIVEFTADGVRLRNQVEIRLQDSVVPVVAYITVEVQGDELNAELQRMKDDKDWHKQPLLPDRPGPAEIDRFPTRGFRIISVDFKPNEKRLGASSHAPPGG